MPQPKVHFLGGYHIDDIIAAYPQLHYIVVPEWQSHSVLHTLFQAPWRAATTIVSYADTIFRPEVIRQAYEQTADVVWVYDAQWRHRYDNRDPEDIKRAEVMSIDGQIMEFTGLLKFSPLASQYMIDLNERWVGQHLTDLLTFLSKKGFSIQSINAEGAWTEFNSPKDIAHFILGTKAETLSRLSPLVKKSVIGEQCCFTVKEWLQKPNDIICEIKKSFHDSPIVIRSSSKSEDNWSKSNAGCYTSILNVDSGNYQDVYVGIESVVASYRSGESSHSDQILIQSFLSDVQFSGVVFTRGLETGSPYYRINFDDQSCSTESVTSGHGAHLRTVLINRDQTSSVVDIAPELPPVVGAVRELEVLLDYDRFDVEFAVDKRGTVHIFQVRPITVDHSNYDISDNDIADSLHQSKKLFQTLQIPTPFMLGEKTLFGVMPDWNPAEIIGIRPRPLAYSLYRFLITDDVWATQRAQFGYRDVRPQPLLVSFCGQPYVDIRASLNSFIPKTVSHDCAKRLVNAYLSILSTNPHLHDKLEFAVAFTVWTPTFEQEAKARLTPLGITHDEIIALSDGLKILTRQALTRLDNDISSLNQLEERRKLILGSDLEPLDKAILLLEDCRQFGTLAFAHAARAGFVAMSFINSLVRAHILSVEDKQDFLNAIKTVAGEFEEDAYQVANDQLDVNVFCQRYGHLRPGTYEITQHAYWEEAERYLLRKTKLIHEKPQHKQFIFSKNAEYAIQTVLNDLGSPISFSCFVNYLISAIKSRESVKFEFTKNLSIALDHFSHFGKLVGLSRESISYLQFDEFKQIRSGQLNVSMIQEIVDQRRRNAKLTKMVELPQLIVSENDFYCFERMTSQPNFITTMTVTAPAVSHDKHDNLRGSIVLVPQADPGYDWLFSHGIAGLITQYGGANSHMAIRAAEMAIPAAIGVGDKLYEELCRSSFLHLDCGLQQVRGLS